MLHVKQPQVNHLLVPWGYTMHFLSHNVGVVGHDCQSRLKRLWWWCGSTLAADKVRTAAITPLNSLGERPGRLPIDLAPLKRVQAYTLFFCLLCSVAVPST